MDWECHWASRVVIWLSIGWVGSDSWAWQKIFFEGSSSLFTQFPHSVPEVSMLCLASRTGASPRQFFQSMTCMSPTGSGHSNGWKQESNGMSLFNTCNSTLSTSRFFSNCTNEFNQKPSWNSTERMMLAFRCDSLDRHVGFDFSLLSSM